MRDEDRTVDADDSTMDELRRLAAEVRARSAASAPENATVDADGATMEELRRFAAQARGQIEPSSVTATSGSITDLAEGSSVERNDFANAVDLLSGTAFDPPSLPSVEAEGAMRTDRAIPELPAVDTPSSAPDSVRRSSLLPIDAVDQTVARGTAPIGRATGASSGHGEGWRPPPRMVMPTEQEKHPPRHHGPWKAITIVLVVVVVLLLAVLLSGMLGGDQDELPPDGSVPGEVTEDGGGSGETDGSGG